MRSLTRQAQGARLSIKALQAPEMRTLFLADSRGAENIASSRIAGLLGPAFLFSSAARAR